MSQTFEIVEKLSEELGEKEDRIMALEEQLYQTERKMYQMEHRLLRMTNCGGGVVVRLFESDFNFQIERMAGRFALIKKRGPRWWEWEWVSDEQWAAEDAAWDAAQEAEDSDEDEDEDEGDDDEGFNPFKK